jgi:hypothetical protein
MSPRRLACALVLLAAAAAGQTASRPSWGTTRIPADFSPAKIAPRIGGMVSGALVDRQLTSDGPGGFIQVRVWNVSLGTARRDDDLYLHVDPKDPPVWVETERRDGFLVLYDASDKLLFVSNTSEAWPATVIATARCPSRRYSAEELACVARFASSRPGLGLGDFTDRSGIAICPPELAAGAIELLFRFGDRDTKRAALEKLRERKPTAAELESVRVCLCDLDPSVQALAAHLILDAGGKVDKQRLRSSLELTNPWGASTLHGPLLRMGDSHARAHIEFLLHMQLDFLTLHKSPMFGTENMWALFEAASWGPKEFIPLVTKFLPGIPHVTSPGTGILAYLQLGAGISFVDPKIVEAIDAQTWAAIMKADIPREAEFLVGYAKPKLQQNPEAYRLAINGVVRNPALAKRFITGVGPPSPKVLGTYREIAFLAAACGDRSSLEGLRERKWEESDLAAVYDFPGEAFATVQDPRAVEVLVAGLIAARRCAFEDCTGRCVQAVAAITKLLAGRSQADRERALGLLDGVPPAPHDQGGQLALIRAALGESPEPEVLLALGGVWFTQACSLSLSPWADRYASVLPTLRSDPRKHAFALGLLRDEASVDALGRLLAAATADPELAGFGEALGGLRLIGGKRALEALYGAAPNLLAKGDSQAARQILQAIVELESPEQWKRVTGLPSAGPVLVDLLVDHAAVQVLAKKP